MSKAVIFFAPGLEECEGLLCVDLLPWPKSWIIPLLMPPSCPAAFRVWTT